MRAFEALWALVEALEEKINLALAKSAGTGTSVTGTGFWKSINGALQSAASLGQPGQLPTVNSVGSDIVWADVFGSWVTISGGTFIPGNSQKALLADTSGAQIIVKTPTNPYDGQDLVIYDYEGFAAVNPIVIQGSGTQTVEDPSNPGSEPIASGHMGMQGMTAWWKYFAGTQQWQLMLVSTPYQATPVSWAQTTWFIDPLNGNDQNPGTTIGKPLQTKAELRRRYGGTWAPQINNVRVTVTYLNPDTTSSDPSLFAPLLLNGGYFIQTAPLPAAGFTGTLNVVTSLNIGTNTILSSTFNTTTGAIAAQMMLVNITRGNSRAFVQRNKGGGNWQLSQPLAPYVLDTFPNPSEVNTWASGDAIIGYTLTNVNIPKQDGYGSEFDAAFGNSNLIYQLNIWDSGLAPGNDNFTMNAAASPYVIECSCNRVMTCNGSSAEAQPYLLNVACSVLAFLTGNSGNGIAVSGGFLTGGYFQGCGLQHNAILASGCTIDNCTDLLTFCIDTAASLAVLGQNIIGNTGRIFGPGTLNVYGSLVIGYGSTAVNALPVATLQLNGKTTGYSNATSAGTTTVHGGITLTAANLDAAAGAAGFGGYAYGGGAVISNLGAQP